jgi:CheY-like chemotaxis protein
MTTCNVLLIEDSHFQRESLRTALESDYGHCVCSFRDLVTFEEAILSGSLKESFSTQRRLVVILDCMLAKKLSPDAPDAPRWEGPGEPPPGEEGKYVDNDLGLRIAQSIRDGEYEGVPDDAPILFFTARRNQRLADDVEKLAPTRLLVKPLFSGRVERAIQDLLQTER